MRARMPALTGFGLGGLEMERAGLDRVVRAEEVAVMGITEVLRHMPRIFREYRRLVRALECRRPAAAVLIDFPDVNFRLAKHCKRLGIPVVWFVSPQLWAWKRRRLRWVQQRVDRMMVIFPFEEPFYRARGVEAEFIGHPLASLPLPEVSREEYARRAMEISQDQWNYSGSIAAAEAHNLTKSSQGHSTVTPVVDSWMQPQNDGTIRYELDVSKQWIALLPGSRHGEVWSNLPRMIEAAYLQGREYEFLVPVANTITEKQLASIQYNTGDWCLARNNPPRITFVRDARAALYHSRAAIVASGTATVQAALIGKPFVVVYRVSPLTFRLAKRLVRYPAEIPAPLDGHGNLPIAMVNLIAGRRIVPELIQDQLTGPNVAAALRPLLEDGPARETMIRDLKEVRQLLTPLDGADPIRRVCDAVQALMNA